MCQQAWSRMVRSTFRKNYTFPENASHNWFPGHMQKGLKSMQRKMADVDCVLEVHDARIPFSGRNLAFKDVVGGARPHILILNKSDLIPESDQKAIRKESMARSPHISKVLFTNCKMRDCEQTANIIPSVSKLVGSEDRWHRVDKPDNTVLVVGIPNTGKSTLINKLRGVHLKIGGRPAPVGARPGFTKSVGERIRVSDRPLVYLLDTPGISVPYIKNMHTGMKLAICATIKDDLVGITSVADYLLWMLNSHENFSYVEHMGLEGPEDEGTIMLAKAGAKLGLFRAFKDVSQGSATKRIPDLPRAAYRFLQGFRTGDRKSVV